MKNNEILFKLRQEKSVLLGKINRLENFRGTNDWNILSANHKQLLDIQLSAMKTYMEALIGRCLDLEETIDTQKEPVEEENNIEDVVKIIVIKKD